MKNVKAAWIEEKLAQDLKGKICYANVLSVHKSVLNLKWGNRLITVATGGTEGAADEMVLEIQEDFMDMQILPEAVFQIKDGAIKGDMLTVDFSDAKPYKLMHQVKYSVPDEKMITELEQWIYQNGKASSLYNGYFNQPEDSALGKYFLDEMKKLKESAMTAEKEELLHQMMEMCGAGIGLTPSADDFIAGVLLIFYAYEPLDEKMYQKSVASVQKKTVSISGYMLANAAKGRGRSSELKLLEAISAKDKSGIEKYLEEVKDFGSTSGTDTLIGMVFGLRYIRESEERKG